MRIITRCWALLAMFCGLMMAATITSAQDAPYQYPLGTETDFTISGERTFEIDGISIHNNYEGDLTLVTLDNLQEETSSTILEVAAFNASGYDERVGSISLTADPEATKAAGLTSSITAYTAESPLPARGTLSFHARITITNEDSEPVVFQSRDPITLSGQINSWGDEHPVEFYQSGETVFFNVDDPNKLIALKDVKSNVVIIPPVKSPCNDPCCYTDAISLNTGFNHAATTVYPVGSSDGYWRITADQCTTRAVPRAPRVITRMAGWAVAQPNTQWIGANATAVDECLGQVTYQKCFCVCRASTLTFDMSILVDDQADVYLDGNYVGSTPDLAFGTPTRLNFIRTLAAGTHCIEVIVRNNYRSHAGLNIQGTIQGAGLLKVTCCGQIPYIPPCTTPNLTMGTNNTWTLVSGPADGRPYPRCADIIPNPVSAWHRAVEGTNWIGPNSGGWSPKPPADRKPFVYVYRKCFCVDLPGTYTITLTTMADDAGDVYLNGVLLGTTGGFGAPVTKTYIVALGMGCNCLDFRVRDIGYAVTGLDARINIQGPRLMQEQCCSCSFCKTGFPPTDTPLDLSMQGGEGHTDAAAVAAVPEARPMLVGIPDEESGLTTVHYVLDKEAQAEVALYKASGERVMVLDEGTRAYGAHQVSLATKDLPAGSYRLELVYGGEALSVPVEVQ